MAKKREKLVARIRTLDSEKQSLYMGLLGIVDALEETESSEVKKLRALIKDTSDPEFRKLLESKLASLTGESKLDPTEALRQLYELVGESEVKRFLRLGISTFLNGETWQIKVDE